MTPSMSVPMIAVPADAASASSVWRANSGTTSRPPSKEKAGASSSNGWAALATQERQHGLRRAVRLREHRGARLIQDLQLREVDHLARHVDVADPALGSLQVLLVRGEVVERVVDAVLHGTEVAPRVRHVLDRRVDRRQADRAR